MEPLWNLGGEGLSKSHSSPLTHLHTQSLPAHLSLVLQAQQYKTSGLILKMELVQDVVEKLPGEELPPFRCVLWDKRSCQFDCDSIILLLHVLIDTRANGMITAILTWCTMQASHSL
jgi:hypothetical protein